MSGAAADRCGFPLMLVKKKPSRGVEEKRQENSLPIFAKKGVEKRSEREEEDGTKKEGEETSLFRSHLDRAENGLQDAARKKKFRRHQQRTFFWLLISMRVLSGEKRVFPPLFAGMSVRSCCCCCPSSSTVAMLKSGCGKKASYSLSLPLWVFMNNFAACTFPENPEATSPFLRCQSFFLLRVFCGK